MLVCVPVPLRISESGVVDIYSAGRRSHIYIYIKVIDSIVRYG